MEKEIDVEAFKKAGLSYDEIESIKSGLKDVENGNTISYEDVKVMARKKIFSKSKTYA